MFRRPFVALVSAVLFGPQAIAQTADTIRIATWNMANLYEVEGVPLRSRACARSEAHYEALRSVAERMDADVIALQEVHSEVAVHHVFDPEAYDVFVSGRRDEDHEAGRVIEAVDPAAPEPRRTDGIYTAIAVRRSVVEVVAVASVPSLSVAHAEPGEPDRPTRWGMSLTFRAGDRTYDLLAVHMKSSCHQGALDPPESPHCATFARQVPALEAWIDEREADGRAIIIAGDFNRRINRLRDSDQFWTDIDDGDPEGLNLWRLPYGRETCWTSSRRSRTPIDYLVFNDAAWDGVDRDSCTRLDLQPYRVEDAPLSCLSDHEPYWVDLVVTAAE